MPCPLPPLIIGLYGYNVCVISTTSFNEPNIDDNNYFTFITWPLFLVLHEEPQIRYPEFPTQQHTHPAVIPHVTGCRCTGVIPDAATVLVRPINI